MNIALFGGTFDPVHSGHLSAALAAQQALALDQILFVPARVPPHKRSRNVTAFPHRYAMVALACAGNPGFVPSILESRGGQPGEPNYSILTIRKLAADLSSDDQLYFLIGADREDLVQEGLIGLYKNVFNFYIYFLGSIGLYKKCV